MCVPPWAAMALYEWVSSSGQEWSCCNLAMERIYEMAKVARRARGRNALRGLVTFNVASHIAILDAIANLLIYTGLPWVLQMDAQMDPSVLVDAGWISDVRGVVKSTGLPTCRSAEGANEIDFFIVSQDVAHAFPDAELVLDADTSPHTPIRLTASEPPRMRHGCKLWKPKPFPLERPYGPHRKPPTYPGFTMAKKADDDVLTNQWKELCKTIEVELIGICELEGDQAAAVQGRGEAPRQIWAPLAGPVTMGNTRGSAASRAWRWIAKRLEDMIVLAQMLRRGEIVVADRHNLAMRRKLARGWHPHLAAIGVLGQATKLAVMTASAWDLTLSVNAPLLQIVWDMRCSASNYAENLDRSAAKERANTWKQRIRDEKGTGFPNRLARWRSCKNPQMATARQEEMDISNLDLLDPQIQADIEAKKWNLIWMSHGTESVGSEPRPWEQLSFDVPLVKIALDKFVDTCNLFKWQCGIGADFWHPRWWTWLSRPGIMAIIRLVVYIQRYQHWPSAVRLILYFLQQKPTGGFRPIGVLTSLVRVVERCLTLAFDAWEAAQAKPYDFAGQGGGAEEAILQQMLADEGAAKDEISATGVLDLEKTFEHVTCYRLWEFQGEAKCPVQLLAIMICIFTMGRWIVHNGVISKVTTTTVSAAVAGSLGGTRALKMVILGVCDKLVARWPWIDTRFFVDDISFQAVGARKKVEELQEVVNFYVTEVEARGIPVSRKRKAEDPKGKGFIMMADEELQKLWGKWMEEIGIHLQDGSTKLGIDSAGGKVITRGKQNGRWEISKSRKGQMRLLKSQGADVEAVANQGIIPSPAYGCACVGVTPTNVENARTLVSGAISGTAVGSDRTLKLWIAQADPITRFAGGPVQKWASAVWADVVPPSRLERAWKQSTIKSFQYTNLWKGICGPASTLRATLGLVNWKWPAAHTVITGGGTMFDMRTCAPLDLRNAFIRAIEHVELSKWAVYHLPIIGTRPFLEPIRAVLKQRGKGPQWVAAIRAFVGGDFATQHKLWTRGKVETPECKSCGKEYGTAGHRFFRCEATRDKRTPICDQECYKQISHRAEVGGANLKSALFQRGIVAHPIADEEMDTQVEYSKRESFTTEDPDAVWNAAMVEGEQDQLWTGDAYPDGSGVGRNKLKGYGWGAVLLKPSTNEPFTLCMDHFQECEQDLQFFSANCGRFWKFLKSQWHRCGSAPTTQLCMEDSRGEDNGA